MVESSRDIRKRAWNRKSVVSRVDIKIKQSSFQLFWPRSRSDTLINKPGFSMQHEIKKTPERDISYLHGILHPVLLLAQVLQVLLHLILRQLILPSVLLHLEYKRYRKKTSLILVVNWFKNKIRIIYKTTDEVKFFAVFLKVGPVWRSEIQS